MIELFLFFRVVLCLLFRNLGKVLGINGILKLKLFKFLE